MLNTRKCQIVYCKFVVKFILNTKVSFIFNSRCLHSFCSFLIFKSLPIYSLTVSPTVCTPSTVLFTASSLYLKHTSLSISLLTPLSASLSYCTLTLNSSLQSSSLGSNSPNPEISHSKTCQY